MSDGFRTGDRVRITFDGRTVEGTVTLASSNGCSLFLQFEALLGGYVGTMPVLRDGDVYRDLVHSKEVILRPAAQP